MPIGIDVSQWQLATPSLAGLDFLVARASIATVRDARYPMHVANARAHGLIVGAYHFGAHGPSGAAQAAAFLQYAGPADLFALDLEGSDPMPDAEGRAFVAAVQAAGHKCGLYGSDSGFRDLGQDWDWVANWSQVPSRHWDVHQYRGSPLDLDRYNGTLEQLRALAGVVPPAPPVHYTIHLAPHALVRVYELGHGGCIKPGWVDVPWNAGASQAPASAPVHRTTCDGSSTVVTTIITAGAYARRCIAVNMPGVTLTP